MDTSTPVVLTDEQNLALDAIDFWYRETPENKRFVLGGLAGTGKTTLIRNLTEWLPVDAVSAFTGKAVSVLRKKGIPAKTCHGLMYDLDYEETKKKKSPVFHRKEYLTEKLVVVDEASMVNTMIEKDLDHFGVRVIFVGDHGQLEPVGDNPYIMKNPDFKLEQIQRQLANSESIKFAHSIRVGQPVWHTGKYGDDLEIVPRRKLLTDTAISSRLLEAEQIIVGYNKTRQKINALIRKVLRCSGVVCPGEKIIILRNKPNHGLYNGQTCIVKDIVAEDEEYITLSLYDDTAQELGEFPFWKDQFGQLKTIQEIPFKACLADYAYAVTNHKAQGSTYRTVAFIEEYSSFWSAEKARYTGSTRHTHHLLYLV